MPKQDKITVSVALHATLAKYRPDPKNRAPFEVELASGATVGDLVRKCGMSQELSNLVVIGNARSDYDTVLGDGTVVEMFPPFAGG